MAAVIALRRSALEQLFLGDLKQLLRGKQQPFSLLRLRAQSAAFLRQGGDIFGGELPWSRLETQRLDSGGLEGTCADCRAAASN